MPSDYKRQTETFYSVVLLQARRQKASNMPVAYVLCPQPDVRRRTSFVTQSALVA